MSNNLRILKRYGILVHDIEGRVDSLRRIPNRQDGETFGKWKKRVFGESVDGLMVYCVYEPAPQTRMTTLAQQGGADYLRAEFQSFRELAEEDAQATFEEEKEEIIARLTTLPKTLLQEIVEEHESELELSAVEFLNRYINRNERSVDTREILVDLIRTYSRVVTMYRAKGDRQDHRDSLRHD